MGRWRFRSGILTLLACTLGACGSGKPCEPDYRPVPLTERDDPLAGERAFQAWNPPRQLAAFVHPHEDREQGIMIAGHWIMILLGEGSWYFQDEPDREPVPDAEASPEEIRAGLGALSVPAGAVIPFRTREPAKP